MKRLYFVGALLFVLGSIPTEAKDTEKNWKLHAELSYVKTSGNSKTETFATKVETSKALDKSRLKGKAEAIYSKSDGTETANRWYILGVWERTFTEKMFAFLQADYLVDKFAGFKYRTSLAAGIGYDLISTEKHDLKGLLSLGYASQKYEDGGSENYPNLRLDINYVWKILENLKFKEDFNYQTSLSDTSLYYVNSDSSVQVKINTHFSLGVGLKIAYQNKPPTDDIKKTDTTFLTSLIVDY